MAFSEPCSRKSKVLLLTVTESQDMNWKDSWPSVRNLLLFIWTVATVAFMAPCLEMDWITEFSRMNLEIPATTDFCDRELMLQLWKLREVMMVLSEKAPRSILFIDTWLKVILLMNNPEKDLAFTLSILLFCIVIDLNDDGNTFGDSDGEEILTNFRLIVGSSVGTFSLKALCSKTSSLTLIALKLRIPAKAFGWMTVLRELMMLKLTVCDCVMDVWRACWWMVSMALFSMLISSSLDTDTASLWSSTCSTSRISNVRRKDSDVKESASNINLGHLVTFRCSSFLESEKNENDSWNKDIISPRQKYIKFISQTFVFDGKWRVKDKTLSKVSCSFTKNDYRGAKLPLSLTIIYHITWVTHQTRLVTTNLLVFQQVSIGKLLNIIIWTLRLETVWCLGGVLMPFISRTKLEYLTIARRPCRLGRDKYIFGGLSSVRLR